MPKCKLAWTKGYAWFPVKTEDAGRVWLRCYWLHNGRRYVDAPGHIRQLYQRHAEAAGLTD